MGCFSSTENTKNDRFDFGGTYDASLEFEIVELQHTENRTAGNQEMKRKGGVLLVKAAQTGDVPEVRRLLAEGTDVNQKGYFDNTALHHAASNGDEKCTAVLIGAGCALNVVDTYNRTPLFKAARDGHIECLLELIKAGGSLEITSVSGKTALMEAASWGHTECVRALVDAGSKVNRAYEDGSWTALLWASHMGQADAVRVLADAGAKLDYCRPDGCTALFLASNLGHTECVQALIDAGSNVEVVDNKGRNALFFAMEMKSVFRNSKVCGPEETMKELVSGGCPINAVDYQNRTPLHAAVQKGRFECARALLRAGFDVNVTPANPLFDAIGPGPESARMMRLLLKAGADKNRQEDGKTPLMKAVKYPEAVTALIEAGCDLEAANERGKTALMHAVLLRKPQTVYLLIEAGCDLDRVDSVQKTAFQWALDMKMAKPSFWAPENEFKRTTILALMIHGCDLGQNRDHVFVQHLLQEFERIREMLDSALTMLPDFPPSVIAKIREMLVPNY